MDHDEEERLQSWRRGDEAAAREVFARYYPRAVRIALLSGLSSADAQDCAQDAFVQAYERRTQLRDLKAFPLWFHRIVTRRILDTLSGPRKRERPLESESGAESWRAAQMASYAPPSDELVVLAEEREEIWRWVQALAPRARTAIVLRYYADFSTREVASMLDVREGAARVILHRAIAELRERMRAAHEPTPAYTPER